MINKYLIRLDDACPTMDHAKWRRILEMLDSYGIRPMIGVIPHNEDPMQKIDAPDPLFWEMVKDWQNKKYAIALHGYNHCYISEKGLDGLNPLWKRSEFSGVDYEQQCQKIFDGFTILKNHGIEPKFFFAPSHTFDKNTLKALLVCTPIRIISDTIATKPYIMDNFVFIPQLGGHCCNMKIGGTWTFCLHPSTMKDENFEATESFIKAHRNEFISFEEIDISHLKQKDLFSKFFSWLYFTKRKIRGIK